MQKQEKLSPTTSNSSVGSILDPPGYIEPSLQDMLLTDITAEKMLDVSKRLGVEYLSSADNFPASFPASGVIFGPNKRLMVNLVCLRQGKNTQPLNIVFLIDTGSPASYLSEKAMEALTGKIGSNLVNPLPVMVHSHKVMECHLSPLDSHFADVNILGMDFLSKNMLSLSMNHDANTFELVV